MQTPNQRPPKTPAKASAAGTLRALAKELERLEPDTWDPEKYFCDKSEIVHKMRKLAAQL